MNKEEGERKLKEKILAMKDKNCEIAKVENDISKILEELGLTQSHSQLQMNFTAKQGLHAASSFFSVNYKKVEEKVKSITAARMKSTDTAK
ncbi:MAG: hypothetical protein MHMPM18_001257 [Marteilia pararefringens]